MSLAALLISSLVFRNSLSCAPTESPEGAPDIPEVFTTTIPYCTTTTPVPPMCPSGWTEYNSACYIFQSTPEFTTQTVLNCMALGGNLASVHSAADNAELQTLSGGVAIYFAATRIGVTNNPLTDFANLDGTPFDFSNWAAGSPNNVNTVANPRYCIVMLAGGLWQDTMCSVTKYPYVCQKAL